MSSIAPLTALLRRTAAAALTCVAIASAHAAPLPAAAIPEDARWIIHLDLDAARTSPAWNLFHTRVLQQHFDDIRAKLRVLERITGINLQTELHGITLFGTGFDESSACFLIHAPVDQARLIDFLKLNSEFNTIDNHGQTILVWRDKGRDRLMYGAVVQIAEDPVTVVGPSAQIVALTLDTIAGRSASVKETSPLLPSADPANAPPSPLAHPGIWIAARTIGELPRIQKVESPFLKQMETASLALGHTEDRVVARVAVVASNEKAAQQMAAAADGVKAMVALSAADESATARAKLLASALQNLTITTNGRSVTADWSLSFDKVAAIADLARPGTSLPATRSAQTAPKP